MRAVAYALSSVFSSPPCVTVTAPTFPSGPGRTTTRSGERRCRRDGAGGRAQPAANSATAMSTPGHRAHRSLARHSAGAPARTRNSVPRTPRIAPGVRTFMASGDCRVSRPDTAESVPVRSELSKLPRWVVASKVKRSMTSTLLGPIERRLSSAKVMPTDPSGPVRMTSDSWTLRADLGGLPGAGPLDPGRAARHLDQAGIGGPRRGGKREGDQRGGDEGQGERVAIERSEVHEGLRVVMTGAQCPTGAGVRSRPRAASPPFRRGPGPMSRLVRVFPARIDALAQRGGLRRGGRRRWRSSPATTASA